jgi:3-hydroxyisobutyrate dehydrogenase-like beta-hydroxyacid dehydrogenase
MEKELSIGFIGLGKMGVPMMIRLISSNRQVHVFDIDQAALKNAVAAGGSAAESVHDIANQCDIVMLSLPTPQIVSSVVTHSSGLISGERVHTIIDFSTIGARASKTIAEQAFSRGKNYIDAPVSGGLKGARDGTLSVMVSCDKTLYDKNESLLKTFGTPYHVGEISGQAQTMKLANNLLSCAAIAVTSEAMVMGAKAGLDPTQMLEIINKSTGRNSATQDKFPKSVLTRSFDFGFSTGMSYKDVNLCIDEAEAMGIPMFVGSSVRQMFATTKAVYGEESDFTSLCRVIENWAGIEVNNNKEESS